MGKPDGLAYEFGRFRLNPAEGELLRDGQPVTLTPKAFEALVLLVERRGHLIEKDELMKMLWPDTFVEEANLAHHVWRLRKVLEDTRDSERYIQTVPKRGYRFVAEVKEIGGSGTVAVVEKHTVTRLVAERETTHDTATLQFAAAGKPFALSTKSIVAASVCLGVILASVFYLRFGSDRSALTAPPSTPFSTLAVLPFKPLTNESSDPSLELGMADALITRLSNVKGLTVRPTSAVVRYSSANNELAQIGRELHVDSVLDGRLQRSADRIRLTVQLIRTEDGKPLWAERFDQEFTDIFVLEDSLSEKVASALALQLTAAETLRMQQRYTDNIEAYQSYLKGRYQLNLASEGALRAVNSFEDAIQKDPKFALAYAGLADAYLARAFIGIGSKTPGEQLILAKTAALKALEIDDSLADVHTSLANVLFMYDWNWAEAEKEFKRAIQLNPNLAEAHHGYSQYLQALARWDEALGEIRRAEVLDPLSLSISFHHGLCLASMGRTEEAVTQYRKTLDMDPTTGASGSHWGLAMVYEQKGMYQEAIKELEDARRLDPRPSFRLANLAELYARAGMRKEARKMLDQLLKQGEEHFVSLVSIAQIYDALGDRDQAFAWLNKAIDEREMLVASLKILPFGEVRSDPRFPLLLKRIGLSF